MRTLSTVTMLALLGGCYGDASPPGPPFRAHAITGADGASGPTHAVEPVELALVDDFDALSGDVFRIRRGGAFIVQERSGHIIDSGRFVDGEQPALRYVVEDGVAIPRDYPTLAMISAAHHFGAVYEALETHTGVGLDEVNDAYGIVEILFEPEVRAETSGLDTTEVLGTNAAFVSISGQFLLARRSSVERIPFAADRNVVAHEVGHSVWGIAFHGGVVEDCREASTERERETNPYFPGRVGLEYAVAGVNEGFSDWLSFSITGTPDSLGSQRLGNERSLVRDDFDYGTLTRCEGSFYCLGTLFARSLYDAYVSEGNDPADADARAAFTRTVVDALRHTKETIVQDDLFPEPDATLRDCDRPDEGAPTRDGEVLGGFFEALLRNLPQDRSEALCPALVERFGDTGFPEARRVGCGS